MLMNNNEYIEIIETIKGEIRGAQYKAALSVNRELIMLYYHIGTVINEHKTWGSKFIENLAADIRIAFPNVKGYSVRNLKYMAKYAETYPDEEFVQTVSAQIPWSHNTAILDKVKDTEQRVWYIKKTAENGWSHNVLIHQIESGLYSRHIRQRSPYPCGCMLRSSLQAERDPTPVPRTGRAQRCSQCPA